MNLTGVKTSFIQKRNVEVRLQASYLNPKRAIYFDT
jgi:hypothetical protein